MLTLWSQKDDGSFQLSASSSKICPGGGMLDVVAEMNGDVIARCATVAVVASGGTMRALSLPVEPLGLGRASDGSAVFFGVAADNQSVVRMLRSATGWTADAPFAGAFSDVSVDAGVYFIVGSETSVLETDGTESYVLSLSNGAWQTSPPLSPNPSDTAMNLLSAAGQPMSVLIAGGTSGGPYNLILDTQGANGWQAKTVTAIGTVGVVHQPGCRCVPSQSLVGLVLSLCPWLYRRRRTLTVILVQMDKVRRWQGLLFYAFVVGYGLARFMTEFLRGDGDRGVGFWPAHLSNSQVISLGLVAGCLLLLWQRTRPLFSARHA
jgi:hypothetical protein